MWPGAGVYWIALSTRLSRIWVMASESPITTTELSDRLAGYLRAAGPPGIDDDHSLGGHLRMKYDLKQEISELVSEIVDIVPGNSVSHFIGLFDGVRRDRGKTLFEVPWATTVRIAKLPHDF